MRKLLCANFRRLWRSIWFWLCLFATVCWTMFAFGAECYDLIVGGQGLGTGVADAVVFDSIQPLSFIMAVFVSMFIGAEYSNKTIRNKIIVGHAKIKVYLSNYIVCVIGALIFYLTYFAIFILGGILILGPLGFPQETLIGFLCGILGTAARVAVYVWIAMLIMSKSASIVAAICVSYFALSSVHWITTSLEEPKQYMIHEYDSEIGEYIDAGMVDNPAYIESDVIRKACEFYLDFTPMGQESAYMVMDINGFPENIGWFPVYSFVFGGIFMISGVLIFRRMDLK